MKINIYNFIKVPKNYNIILLIHAAMFVIYVNSFHIHIFIDSFSIFWCIFYWFLLFLSVFMLAQCNMMMKLCKFFYGLTL